MAYFAPAGTPVHPRDVVRGLVAGKPAARAALRASLADITRLPNAFPVSSARAAMTIVLRAMRDLVNDPARDEVVIPAYTCYSVPAAIVRAGLRPRLCDIDPATLSMTPDALRGCDLTRTLAVVTANLYGLPDELPAIEQLCRERGVLLLDDAAQALGAGVQHRPAGSFGDAGLYSFDKGKIITTIQGGAIVCRDNALAGHIRSLTDRLAPGRAADRLANLLKLVVYAICLRPSLYGLVRRLPFTGLGQTRYELGYPIANLSGFQAAIAAELLTRLSVLNEGRRRFAAGYDAAFHDLPGVVPVRLVPGAAAVYARYPLRLRDATKRDAVIAALDRAGIGATASYPHALSDVPEVAQMLPDEDRNCPGAREVAATILTLPTHAYCPPDLPVRVRRGLARCLG